MKLKNVLVALATLFAPALFAQGGGEQTTPAEFGKSPDQAQYTILDVRTDKEWAAGHLRNAVHIDWYAADFAAQVAKLPKDKPVLVYCEAGGRSAKAQRKMTELGFKRVVNLTGGFKTWKAQGNAVVQ